MEKIAKSAVFLSAALWLLLAGTQMVLAQGLITQDALPQGKCTVNGKEVPCEELGKQIGGFLGWGIGAFVVFAVLFVWATIFWIMMIIHAATHNVDNKAMWIVLMVFTGIVGALVYYFVVKRKFSKQIPPSTPAITQ